MKLKIKKVRPDAVVPRYAYDGDAGMDFYSNENLVLKPSHRALVRSGIAMEFPKGYVALGWDKSGISKKGIKTMAGVIDSGYRGEIIFTLVNLSSKNYEVKKGQKIAQVLIQKVERPEVEIVSDLSETARGDGGFGSSGLG